MSFSSRVKDELLGQIPTSRHCGIAEMAAFVAACGNLSEGKLFFKSDSAHVKKKVFTLLKKTYNIDADESAAEGLFTENREVWESVHYQEMRDQVVSAVLLRQSCCRRSFLRGCFLVLGSMSDPGKSYHLELSCQTEPQAMQLVELLGGFEIPAKVTKRKGRSIVYLKEGEAIADFLNVVGAPLCMMDLENLRIEKGLRSDVNRRVNCDTANIRKMLEASQRQIEDIRFLEETNELALLPENLKEVARLRVEYPELNLQQLGELLSPPVGKSGVNHRLRKLQSRAEEIRNKKKN